MKDRKLAAAVCMLLVGAIGLGMAATGCGKIIPAGPVYAQDLMEGVESQTAGKQAEAIPEASADKAAKFGVELLRNCSEKGKNTLISPVSVLCALAMAANGAKGETLEQMEETLGMTSEELNAFFFSYLRQVAGSEGGQLRLANSVWFKNEGFEVNRDFLQCNADNYGADAYSVPFDEGTLKDINAWVASRTDNMIPEILDRIPADAVMYLVNALAFEAEWQDIYKENEVYEGTFYAADGSERKVSMLRSSEPTYFRLGSAAGFVKYYSGQKYGFAALLPDEGANVNGLLAELDAAALRKALLAPSGEGVSVTMPKFKSGSSMELSEVLQSMGMSVPFLQEADFSGLGTVPGANIFISRVLHKTFIQVDERGTKAGAATVVEFSENAAFAEKQLVLDRPFVYMLFDCETGVPFFIGTLNDTE